ncbi:MAG: IS30 family transposase, partial [Clostridia bacterium]
YCDPMASYQKPQVERNHEFIRTVLPKGTSFDSLSQMDIDLMMAHVNSYGRPALGDKSPFEMFAFLYGKKLLDKLLRLTCQRVIPANEIILKPALLRR